MCVCVLAYANVEWRCFQYFKPQKLKRSELGVPAKESAKEHEKGMDREGSERALKKAEESEKKRERQHEKGTDRE